MLDQPDDVIIFRYNHLREFMGAPDAESGRAVAAAGRAKRAAAEQVRPKDWVGTVTATQLAFPYLNLWGFPDKFNRPREMEGDTIVGIGGSPGVVEGVARVVLSTDEFDSLVPGEILVCEMTNPAWQVLYGKIIAVVTNAGDRGPPGGARSRVRYPGGGGHLGRHVPHQDGRSDPRRRQRRRGRDHRRRTPASTVSHEAAITRSVLSDQVKGRLLQAILDGRYPPGARIVETRVAREFGTSQAPVREALRDLEALGVVEVTAFRGARVRHPSVAELLEAFEVRAVLETQAARLALLVDHGGGPRGAGGLPRADAASGGGGRSVRGGHRRRGLPRPRHAPLGQRHAGARVADPGAVPAHVHHHRLGRRATGAPSPSDTHRSWRRLRKGDADDVQAAVGYHFDQAARSLARVWVDPETSEAGGHARIPRARPAEHAAPLVPGRRPWITTCA